MVSYNIWQSTMQQCTKKPSLLEMQVPLVMIQTVNFFFHTLLAKNSKQTAIDADQEAFH